MLQVWRERKKGVIEAGMARYAIESDIARDVIEVGIDRQGSLYLSRGQVIETGIDKKVIEAGMMRKVIVPGTVKEVIEVGIDRGDHLSII